MSETTVVCLGDSITRGQVSVPYVDLLRSRFPEHRIVNAGVNYDLAYNALGRLEQVIAERPDVVTVLLGTNDANATLSERNRRMMTRTRKLPTRPTAQWFRENLEAIVTRLGAETGARIALLGLPVIGEELDSEPLRRAGEYSGIVREVAAAHDCAYLPLHERQVEYLRATGHRPGTRYRDGMLLSSTAATQHFVLRREFDAISAGRGLLLSTDTVHQNSTGARMIAELIAEFVEVG
ncbi:SGNH/GDSL hydrolase family protein [Sciscionella sediminilitoris]|uniref:SGNH/GDSL hydrolase family protein n=1 Tax=Sciscionella sediminilitoris TaxID=1445613 RepID=UPI0004DF7782|nr:GDSL-type esterase/lipase family protein [Sciscionella sp. SE31]